MAATAVQNARQERMAQWRAGMKRRARRTGALAGGGALIGLGVLGAVALASYKPTDPSINTASDGAIANWLGAPGAVAADLLLFLWGLPAALLLPFVLLLGLRVARGAGAGRWLRALLLTALGLILTGTAAALLSGEAVNSLPAGWGGAFGLSLAKLIGAGLAAIGEPSIVEPFRIAALGLSGVAGLVLIWLGLAMRPEELGWIASRRLRRERSAVPAGERFVDDIDHDDVDLEDRPARAPVISTAEPSRTVINERNPAPALSPRRPTRDRQPSLALGDAYQLPPLELLSPAPPPSTGTLDKAALERNARLLETVLEDFSVKGEIVEVRPGPVVTMYELEPASGIKASRGSSSRSGLRSSR